MAEPRDLPGPPEPGASAPAPAVMHTPGRAASKPGAAAVGAAASAGSLLAAVAAFALLNALLTFENRWPTLGVRFSPRLSFELCMGVLAMLGWIAWRGPLPRRALGVLAGLTTFWVVARYLDVTVPAVFGRPVNLYWDGRHAWEVARLAAQAMPGWQVAAIVLGGVVGLWGLYRVSRWALRALARALAWHPPRPWLLLAGAGLFASYAVHPYVERDTRWFFSLPVAKTVARQAVLLPAALSSRHTEARLTPSPAFTTDLSRLRGADVVIVFAEAYGVTTLDDPGHHAALHSHRQALQQALDDSGRAVVSARVRAPTFGGSSWLSHAALLAGVDTRDPNDHDLLLTTTRPTLVTHFARHGYRTVGWMPGLQRPWPEGAFYRFDRLAGTDAIGYQGLPFGYWRIPDQASMALLHAQELAPGRVEAQLAPGASPGDPEVRDAHQAAAERPTERLTGHASHPAASPKRAPRFVVFPTVTSHAPFRPVAPYVEDWARLITPQAYSVAQQQAAGAEPVSWRDATPAYRQSMAYTFDWLAGYWRTLAPPGLLMIVIGDHQPLATVTGPGASWEVPVHIIGTDRALLRRFEALGFTPGLEPMQAPLGDMHELTDLLLAAFDACETLPARGRAPGTAHCQD